MTHTISITRLDYKNPIGGRGGMKMLPAISSFEEILDVNEVRSIIVGHFYSKAEAEILRGAFPKSYKAMLISGFDHKEGVGIDFDKPWWGVFFKFDTFWMNGVTGGKNESATERRLKVINKIKQIA